jgi:hypothetical protein
MKLFYLKATVLRVPWRDSISRLFGWRAIVSYNASAVKIYKATSSLVRFEN